MRDVSIDVGEPFVLSVSFDATLLKFGLTFNNEELDPLIMKSKEFFTFQNVNTSGAFSVNYVGFTKSGNFQEDNERKNQRNN